MEANTDAQVERELFTRLAPEAGLLIGAGRAILLQLAHPQIGLAIATHSDFASNPLSRLIHTLGYIYALSNGTPEQQRTMVDYVNTAHQPVHGTRNPDQETPAYSALDPRLQLWVAATLYDSARVIAAEILPKAESSDNVDLYHQYARLGDALQMPAHFWPDSLSEFDEYFDRTLSTLSVTPQIRSLADELFLGRNAPWWIRIGLPVMRDVTIAQLPPSVREQFGYELSPKVAKRSTRVISFARFATGVLPKFVRHAPMRMLLRHVDQMG
ncbi:oxygenase MpaB family protein [Glutamicibacter arilaitensis]|uniref:oxygenase MpaB family protein n=1 Tax=Glutamicibacter arilaitensis TaxID=256701 RepID=UPI00384B6D9E